MLDDSSLMSAALVSDDWHELCYNDPVLRRRLRNFIKETRALKERKENCDLNSNYYKYSSAPNRAVTSKLTGNYYHHHYIL